MRNTYQSNKSGTNYRQDNRRDSYRQDNRNKQNYRGSDSQQRYGGRSESIDRSRNSSDNSKGRDRNRDGHVQQRARTLSDDRERSRSRSNPRGSTNRDQLRCYRCGEYDHFGQECPKTPMDNEMGHRDTKQASLQMQTHDNLPLNSNGEVEYLNL